MHALNNTTKNVTWNWPVWWRWFGITTVSLALGGGVFILPGVGFSVAMLQPGDSRLSTAVAYAIGVFIFPTIALSPAQNRLLINIAGDQEPRWWAFAHYSALIAAFAAVVALAWVLPDAIHTSMRQGVDREVATTLHLVLAGATGGAVGGTVYALITAGLLALLLPREHAPQPAPPASPLPNLARFVPGCPVCKSASLQRISLEPALEAYHCESCGGHWIASLHYWQWLETLHFPPPEITSAEVALPVAEHTQAKQCPWDGHIILRHEIGNDVPFYLEQCGWCNSFWLDRNKWEVLRSRNLHVRLHKISTDAWQRQIRYARRKRYWQATYTQKFGAEEYARLQELKRWLDQHPDRRHVLTYLAREDPYDL